MGRYTETHNEKNVRWIAHVARSANETCGEKPKLISLVALANRNAKAGEKPTPALIETTAHAKRWCFGLSRKKSGPALMSAGPNCAKSAVPSRFS
jgi:hypothetical protein